jgi:Holliday junction resolvase RusA-like endonuclease
MSAATITRQQLIDMANRAGPGSPLHELVASTRRSRSGGKRAAPMEIPPSLGRTLTLTVPMPASLSNASGKSRNFWAIAGNKRLYFRQLDSRVTARLIPAAPSPAFGICTVTTTMYLGARMDVDNAMARHKWPLDWLQERGYIVNDRLIDWSALPVMVVKRGQDYRIDLTLTEPAP